MNQLFKRNRLSAWFRPSDFILRLVACLLLLWGWGALAQPFPGGGFGGFGGQGGGNRSRSSSTTTYPGNTDVGDAVISIDPETRSLVVIADERTRNYISQVVSNLDRPKPQVLIKVVFVELQRTKASDIGVEGAYGKQGMNGTISDAAAGHAFGLGSLTDAATNVVNNRLGMPVSSFNAVSPITSQGAGLYQILGQDYQVTLRAIAQAGNAKVLSRPSIIARNNQPATINVGQSVPLVSGVRYDNYGNVINTISYTSVGIIVTVTPFITSDGMVEMIVAPETSSLVADRTQWVPISDTASAPIINSRSADTVVVTPDGQTVIIGGLMETSKAESVTKIPLVGDIPLVGALFRRTIKSDVQTELMIFLTPYIIPAPTQMAALSDREQERSTLKQSLTEQEINRFLEMLPNKSSGAPPVPGPSAPPAPKAKPRKGARPQQFETVPEAPPAPTSNP